MNFLEKALEYIFLPCCGICGKLGEGYLCKECGKLLEKYMINDNLQFKRNESIEKMHILKYEDIIRKAIIQYKFNDKSYLYKTFCEIIVKNKKALDFIKSYDIIIPVPIHKKRMRKRGYNQCELISKRISKIVGISMYTDVLIKTKNNVPQSTLNKKSRMMNAKNVYKIHNLDKIQNKKVLVFDDIYTTGSTVCACVEELKKASPSKIGILTLAKD